MESIFQESAGEHKQNKIEWKNDEDVGKVELKHKEAKVRFSSFAEHDAEATNPKVELRSSLILYVIIVR